jgi:hypothetical protein
MSYTLEPALSRDLSEAKAALARHGIVIIRALEDELEPAIMAEIRDSLQASPRKLAQIGEDDLDEYIDQLREAAEKPSDELRALYTRLIAKLGTEEIPELAKELEGIDQLFRWDRVAKVLDPVNRQLAAKGFRPIALDGPQDISEDFRLEFAEKWSSAYERFKKLVDQAADEIKRQEEGDSGTEPPKARKKR